MRTAFSSIFRLMRMPTFIQTKLFGGAVSGACEDTGIGPDRQLYGGHF
jgi:hypothetical protein